MAANKQRGEVPFKSGGKTYVIKPTTNALCEMQTASGHTFEETIKRVDALDVVEIRLFLWALLKAHHPDLTVDDVGEIIDGAGGLAGVQQQIAGAVLTNLSEAPKSNGHDKRNPLAARAGTGGKSTSTPGA